MEILEEISWFVRPISCPVLVILPSSPLSHSCLSLHSFCHLSHLGYRASKQALWKRTLTSTDSPNIPPTISPCYNPLIHNSQKTPRNLPETHYSKVYHSPTREPSMTFHCLQNECHILQSITQTLHDLALLEISPLFSTFPLPRSFTQNYFLFSTCSLSFPPLDFCL